MPIYNARLVDDGVRVHCCACWRTSVEPDSSRNINLPASAAAGCTRGCASRLYKQRRRRQNGVRQTAARGVCAHGVCGEAVETQGKDRVLSPEDRKAEALSYLWRARHLKNSPEVAALCDHVPMLDGLKEGKRRGLRQRAEDVSCVSCCGRWSAAGRAGVARGAVVVNDPPRTVC